jgi:hypothetical protein
MWSDRILLFIANNKFSNPMIADFLQKLIVTRLLKIISGYVEDIVFIKSRK